MVGFEDADQRVQAQITRKQRFRRAINGINGAHLAPDVASTTTLAASVTILALPGLCTVMFLPLDK